MNEVVRLFRNVNNRKPTEKKSNRQKLMGNLFSESRDEDVNPQQAQLSDQVTQPFHKLLLLRQACLKAKIIIASVLGAIVLVALSFGGYAFMHLQGKIPEGTYLLETYRFYHKDKKKMVDGMEYFKKSGLGLMILLKSKVIMLNFIFIP
ncbi:MAG: hypothetical protein ACLTZB_00625 [Streptococcus salivarius]